MPAKNAEKATIILIMKGLSSKIIVTKRIYKIGVKSIDSWQHKPETDAALSHE